MLSKARKQLKKIKKTNYKKTTKNKKQQQYGGTVVTPSPSIKTEITTFQELTDMITSTELKNGTMLIGVDYKCGCDMNRNILERLHPDFCWAGHPNDCKDTPGNQWHQIYIPFQIHDTPIHAIPSLNKFKLIVFDASTTKFLFKLTPSFLAYLYYYFLELGGELYLNFNEDSFNSALSFLDTSTQAGLIPSVNRIREMVNSLTPSNIDFFGKKFVIPKYSGFFTGRNRKNFEPVNAKNIIDNNMAYLRMHLMGSTVELVEASEEKVSNSKSPSKPNPIFIQHTYPIPQTNYSIGPYLKITKVTVPHITSDVLNEAIYRDSTFYNRLFEKLNYRWIEPLISIQSFNPTYPLNCIFI